VRSHATTPFEALKAGEESISVWIDGELLMQNTGDGRVRGTRRLTGARRYSIRIVYQNNAGRPELKFLWWAGNLDKARVPADLLYEKTGAAGEE